MNNLRNGVAKRPLFYLIFISMKDKIIKIITTAFTFVLTTIAVIGILAALYKLITRQI